MLVFGICKNNVKKLVFYLSKLLFKDNICKNNYFLLFYYFIMLYPCLDFLKFSMSLCPAMSYPCTCFLDNNY